MSWEMYFVMALLLFAIASFIWERIPPDLTAITVFGVLLFTAMLTKSTELPTLQGLLDVFSNPAPITIAGMFIVSAALERTGAIDLMTTNLRRFIRPEHEYAQAKHRPVLQNMHPLILKGRFIERRDMPYGINESEEKSATGWMGQYTQGIRCVFILQEVVKEPARGTKKEQSRGKIDEEHMLRHVRTE